MKQDEDLSMTDMVAPFGPSEALVFLISKGFFPFMRR
jgi:hypothetical protein